MRFRLRTLLIVLALGPPVLAAAWGLWSAMASPEFADGIAQVACGAFVFLAGGAAIWWAVKGLSGRSRITRFIAASALTFVPLVSVLSYFAPELGPGDAATDNLMLLMVISIAGLVGLLAAVRRCSPASFN